MTDGPIRELSYEDRATWGECPVCSAPHGEWCHSEIGLQLGVKVGGGRLQTGEGAHLARLQNAPRKVREVPVHGSTLYIHERKKD